MKFLLATLGSIGDLMPFLAVADTLRQRGHQVVLASNAGYAALVRGSGFEFGIISERPAQPLDEAIARDPQAAWKKVREEAFFPAIEPTRNFIAHHLQSGPCKVIASWNVFGAGLAQREFGMPLYTAYLSPQALNEDAENAGRKIGFYPSWFGASPEDVTLTGFPMVDDALVPPLPPELEKFLAAGDAPVIFTPGSFMRRAESFFHEALAACEQLGLRGVFLTPHSDQVPARLPSTISHFKFISLQRLARYAVALVHHGGIGTCAQGLRAGIPQLLSPLFFDQPDNAARIEALGVGRRYRHGEIREGLEQLLHSQTVRESCDTARKRFDGQDANRQICEIAESAA
jgi:UDP:flavonoid glycosyltransferase YjiC (YdhE family)